MADETTINSNNYSYPLYADSHPKFGADAKESSSTIQKPETALTKQAPNDGGNDSDWAATLSANFQAKHGAKQQSTLHPESRDFIAQRVLRQDSNATLVDFARRMSRSDTSKIQLEVTSPINSTAPSVLPKFQLEVTAPTSSSIPLKSSKLSHEWDNASPFGKTDGHPNLNLIPSDNGDITRNRRQSSDATLVEGGSWMRRDSAGHESWRGRLGSDTSTIASRRASRTKLRQGSAPWAPLLPDVPEPGYFESDRMKIDKSFTFSTPLIVERDPLKGIARPPSIEDEDESSVDPLSQIRVAPQEPAVDLLPAHYDPEPVVQDPFTDKMYPVIENPVDPARQLKRKDLINQRVLFSSAILSVNTAMLIVALVAPARTSGIWVLAFICFIKAKDCLSSVIACIDITVKAIYRLFKPLPAVESKWILSLIPAFSESEEQIVKTVFSLRDNNVAPHKQVMAIVLDGKQRDIKQHMRITRSFRRHYVTSRFKRNELIINAGFMEDVPVICFEKAKNAGKKDSLILCHDLFNVMRDNAPLYTKLLREDIWDDVLPELVGADFPGFDMVFCTDADSTIHKGAVKDLADAIGRDSKSIAACGLVLVELEEGEEWSFWNLYQQFQYNFGQFVRRQAESSWGKVTCLPGCVTMIAVRPEMAGAIRKYAEPITAYPVLLHQVQYLGTDRRLTYSMLSQSSALHTLFVPSAVSETVAPQSLKHYLSQRRRWGSNAYFNNYFYCFGENMYGITRLWAFIELLRMSVVYYRIANTALFIYGLTRSFSIMKIAPLLVVSQLPTLWFLVNVCIQKELRIRSHKIMCGLMVNKIMGPVMSAVIFTSVVRNLGSQAWGMTGGGNAAAAPEVATPSEKAALRPGLDSRTPSSIDEVAAAEATVGITPEALGETESEVNEIDRENIRDRISPFIDGL